MRPHRSCENAKERSNAEETFRNDRLYDTDEIIRIFGEIEEIIKDAKMSKTNVFVNLV